jgi:hypothetical protein
MIDDEYLWDTSEFNHSPARSPREGVIGEQVFSAQWAKLMEDDGNLMEPPNAQFARVLCTLPKVQLDQRAATVAASMVNWFGTNIGRAFLNRAELMSNAMLSKSEAYVAAWSIENMRRSYDGGIRTLEHCLMTDAQMARIDKTLPTLTATDLEVAEHLAMWLGESRGQAFLRKCFEELERREAEDQRQRLAEHEQRLIRHRASAHAAA